MALVSLVLYNSLLSVGYDAAATAQQKVAEGASQSPENVSSSCVVHVYVPETWAVCGVHLMSAASKCQL